MMMEPSKKAIEHPISKLAVRHGEMTLGEVARLNEQLEQENSQLRRELEEARRKVEGNQADLDAIRATFKSRGVTCEAHDDNCESSCCLVHSVSSVRDAQRQTIEALAEALRKLSWTEQGCWCVDFAKKCLEKVMRHDEDCQRSRAALAAAGLRKEE